MCPRRRWWARWMRRTDCGARRRRQGARVRRQGARVARARPGDGVPRVASGLARQAAREGVGACAHGAVGGRDGCVAKRSEHSHVTDIVEGAADAVVLSGADRHASPVRGHRYRHPRVVDRILTVDVAANLGPRPAALRVHAHVAAVGVVLCGADGHTRAVRRHRYSPPGRVARSLAVDVAANLGPRPAALRVHAHVAALSDVEPLVPSFPEAPMATRVPSEDIDTDRPDRSPAASPSMSPPTWVHVPPLSEYTRT